MIFVAVGTQLPFNRMVDTIDRWAKANGRKDIFAQVGDTETPPRFIEWAKFLTPEEFEERLDQAEVVIAHAGMGTILGALLKGKRIIVMPRLARLHEQRNDHQTATAQRLSERGLVDVVLDEAELEPVLDSLENTDTKTAACISKYATPELIGAIETFINNGNVSGTLDVPRALPSRPAYPIRAAGVDTLQVVMLAGAIRPSPLRQAAMRPLATLPLDEHTTVLDAWMQWLGQFQRDTDVLLVINQEADLERLEACAAQAMQRMEDGPHVRIVRDPVDWRGSAGVVADLRETFAFPDAPVVVIESSCLPPLDYRGLLDPLLGDAEVVIGATVDCAPAGVCVLQPKTLDVVPDIGYFDLKEQLIPSIRKRGQRVCSVEVTDCLTRIRTLESYITAIQRWAMRYAPPKSMGLHHQATGRTVLDRGPRLGTCIIEAGAEVSSDAVVHDSIILEGASVHSGAVISRSLVASGVLVQANERIVRRTVGGNDQARRKIEHAGRSGNREQKVAVS